MPVGFFSGLNKYIILAALPLALMVASLALATIGGSIVFLFPMMVVLPLTAGWIAICSINDIRAIKQNKSELGSEPETTSSNRRTVLRGFLAVLYFLLSPLCLSFLSLVYALDDTIVMKEGVIKNTTSGIITGGDGTVPSLLYIMTNYADFIENKFDTLPYTIALLVFAGITLLFQSERRRPSVWVLLTLLVFSVTYLGMSQYAFIHAKNAEKKASVDYHASLSDDKSVFPEGMYIPSAETKRLINSWGATRLATASIYPRDDASRSTGYNIEYRTPIGIGGLNISIISSDRTCQRSGEYFETHSRPREHVVVDYYKEFELETGIPVVVESTSLRSGGSTSVNAIVYGEGKGCIYWVIHDWSSGNKDNEIFEQSNIEQLIRSMKINDDNAPLSPESMCGKEGEVLGNQVQSCCEGLKPKVSGLNPSGVPGGLFYCSK